MIWLTLLIFIAVLAVLILVHELGHFFTARKLGVAVEEFGFGFPPRMVTLFKKNGTIYSLNWLPLGGFVKLQGESDAARKKGDYGAATFPKKTKILLAGVLTNWLLAALLLSVLALTGLPKILQNQVSIPSDTVLVSYPVEITSITKNFPAAKAGFQTGDTIIRFDGQKVPSVNSLTKLIKLDRGKNVTVIYKRNGIEKNAKVGLKKDIKGEIFGAGLGQRELIKATWSAPIVGVATTAQFTWLTIQGTGDLLGSLVNGLISQLSPITSVREKASLEIKAVGDSVTGPVGIIGKIFPAARQAGLTQLIFLTAIISLSLAVMNILPIPALDGGRWFVLVIFRLLKKKLTREREEKIQLIGFSVLMGLVILVTITDVAKLF